MIPAATNPNLIPIPNASLRFFFIFDFLFLWLFLSAVFMPPITSMGIEHHLTRKRSFALCSANQTHVLGHGVQASKKLRRLPHVFSRVLELPVKSDAVVEIEVSSSCFRFVVGVDESVSVCGEGGRVGARVVNVYPGMVKVVMSRHGIDEELKMDGLELDRWRFRLPVTTRPERATAVCVDGELVVTVPKYLSGIESLIEEVY